MEDFECYLLELTGHYTPFHDGWAAPVLRRIDNGAYEHCGSRDHPLYARVKSGALWMDPEDGLTVRTPAGDWAVDSKECGNWTRDGALPRITVVPSIKFATYHGSLTNGVLKELP